MKNLLVWSGLFLLASGLTTLALYDNGHISLVWQDWVMETSVSFALLLFIAGFATLYLGVRLMITIWQLPKRLRQRKALKQAHQSQNHASQGLMALEYGDWQTAEKQLLKSAKYSDAGVMNYLTAAKMAHNQGAYDRRDRYLDKAKSLYPDELLTIGLVQARLLSEQDAEHQKQAVALLKALLEQAPHHRALMAEYLRQLQKLGAWHEIEKVLPQAQKLKSLTKPEWQTMQVALMAHKLRQAPDLETLEALWQSLPRALTLTPDVLAEYVEQKMGWGEESGLTDWIEKALKKQWHERLVYQYGRLKVSPAFQRLKVAQKWLEKHPESPVLLLTLGRLACMSQLWAQGQHYLKQSLKRRPEIETFHALAQCYEAEGAQEQAALTYKEAILQLEHLAPNRDNLR